jgi:exopolyphosphatase/guanosine-5'-triphosphate,3'-diphosphate pyrophosphatase
VTIVPRWEWRAFGERNPFGSIAAGEIEDRDELYLLTPAADASVKVSDGLVDVKRLLEVDDDGLERWVPVLKARFPLDATEVEMVLCALGARIPATLPDECGFDELLAIAGPRVHPVRVLKRREHYVVGGCQAERTHCRVGAEAAWTVAVEAEDPVRVKAVLREYGLSSRANTCMARGLKALAGVGARRFAAIDVGTNSVKFRIGERAADGRWQALVDRAEVTRLGERHRPD